MKSLNAPQNCGSVIGHDDLSLGGLDLEVKRVQEAKCTAGV